MLGGYKGNINLYAYVGNDPVGNIDPSGMCGTRIENYAASNCVTYSFVSDDSGGSASERSGHTNSLNHGTSSTTPSEIPTPENIPGGPWEPKSSEGGRKGSFQGPRQEKVPRSQLQWVPKEADGGTKGSKGYWKRQLPHENKWQRFSPDGKPITVEQAHPNPKPFILLNIL